MYIVIGFFFMLFSHSLSVETHNHILVIAPPLFSHIVPSLELAKQLSNFSHITFLISAEKIHDLERKGLLNTFNKKLDIVGLNDGVNGFLDFPLEDKQINLTNPTRAVPTKEQQAKFHSTFHLMNKALEQLFFPNNNIHSLKLFTNQSLTTRPISRPISMIIIRSITPLPILNLSIPIYLFLPSNLRGVVNYLHLNRQTDLFLDYLWKNIQRASGFICNSLKEFDGKYVDEFYQLTNKQAPIHFVGPMIFNSPKLIESKTHQIIHWLDTQPEASVIYIAFGSVARLPFSVIEKILQVLSSYSFIWALKTNETLCPSLFNLDSQHQFILDWAPQREILSHPSISFFFSHGGWNSLLEGMIYGKSMLVWPFFGDQFENAQQIIELGIARQISGDLQIDIQHMLTNTTYAIQAKQIQQLVLQTRDLTSKNELRNIISRQKLNQHIDL